VIAHGSLGDPTEYVRDCVAGAEQLDLLARREPGALGLLLGHTHTPLACDRRGERPAADRLRLADDGTPWLLNAGSAGQARERLPLARALVLDTDAGEALFLALEYDVESTRSELRAAGLPPSACHLKPGRVARFLRNLRTSGH
jgi:predicted phosphodiesterase